MKWNGKVSVNRELSTAKAVEVAFPDGSWYSRDGKGAGGVGSYHDFRDAVRMKLKRKYR